MDLPLQERVAHLFRRFGLGASESEIQLGVSLGFKGTLDHLFDYEKIVEPFLPTPWEVCSEPGEGIILHRDRIALWWALRLLTTARPFEQKMMFFWHNHFALGGDKIEFAPMFIEYLETLKRGCLDHYPELLMRISQDPAMITYLDLDSSVKGRPNENFARELMELFSIGIGNYTESDVMEASRAFTGWSCRTLLEEDPAIPYQERLRHAILRGAPLVASTHAPNLFDPTPKTVLGKSGLINAEQITKLLSRHPMTTRRIVTKLWRFFGSDKIPPKAIARLERVYTATDGNIRSVLREMAVLPEFWAPDCIRQKVKSPLDFSVTILRQLDLTPTLMKIRGNASPTDQIAAPIRNVAYLLHVSLIRQGLALLDPPDVGGWQMGDGWLTPANTIHRVSFADFVFAPGQKEVPFASHILTHLQKRNLNFGDRLIEGLASQFDFALSPRSRRLMVGTLNRCGGLSSLKTPERATYTLTMLGRLMFSAPEFQLC